MRLEDDLFWVETLTLIIFAKVVILKRVTIFCWLVLALPLFYLLSLVAVNARPLERVVGIFLLEFKL